MSSSRYHKLFDELGLLAQEAEQVNPLAELGLDPEFAESLLQEDPSGEALQNIAHGMHRVLARRYHSDNPDTGNTERFRELDEADRRIGAATPQELGGWAKRRKTTSASRGTSQGGGSQERQQTLVMRAAELVQRNMELGPHPQHFSQMEWSQGVLLRRKAGALLLRQEAATEIGVLPGRKPGVDSAVVGLDFHTFLMRNRLFGLPSGKKIAAYIDERGRASLLTPTLDFVMDITDPVRERRERRDEQTADGALWARSAHPLLLVTQTPGAVNVEDSGTQVTMFPNTIAARENSANMSWRLSMNVAGTVEDADFFRRARPAKAAGTVALKHASQGSSASHFRLLPVTAAELILRDAHYTPLVAPGNFLLLYDQENGTPMATDAQVIGMLGNGSQAA